MSNVLRNIPSVNELLESPPIRDLVGRFHRNTVVSSVRTFLTNLREDLQHATTGMNLPNPAELAHHIAQFIVREQRALLQPVVNATGIILHTGLGRAPLAKEALDELVRIGGGYASLEIDLVTGERSQRAYAVERLLVELTSAEAATVVNNNAAATVLTLAALAAGREVVVSRGQLIEIGGSYRLPDVMSASGAVLREVGTTNKTRIGDFERASGESTAALLRVHPSNFAIVGFTEQPSLEELVELGRRRGVPVIDDIGSGALFDFARYGLTGEPVARDSLRAGADLVLFSGDKLLGGPQCGIIAGRKALVEQIMQHPLARAMRVDKLTLAALNATLSLYLDIDTAERGVPLLRLLSTPAENLQNRAERLAAQLATTPGIAEAAVRAAQTYLGGGSLPTQSLPTWCVELRPATESVDVLAARLRQGTPAVVARIQNERLVFDLRSVFPQEDSLLVEALQKCCGAPPQPA